MAHDDALLRDILKSIASIAAKLDETREELIEQRRTRDRAQENQERITKVEAQVTDMALVVAKAGLPNAMKELQDDVAALDRFRAQALVVVGVASLVGSIVSSVIVFLITRSIGA